MNSSVDKQSGDSAALVRDLRHGSWTAQVEGMLYKAADRIEELERKLAVAEEQATLRGLGVSASSSCPPALTAYVDELERRAQEQRQWEQHPKYEDEHPSNVMQVIVNELRERFTLPESGQINAAGQEAESAMPVKGAREGVTEAAQHAAPAPAAPLSATTAPITAPLSPFPWTYKHVDEDRGLRWGEIFSGDKSVARYIYEQDWLAIQSALSSNPAPSASAANDPMENWLMKPALEWLEQAEHGHDNGRCKIIADILRDLWRRQRPITEVAPVSSSTRIMGYDLGRPGGDQTVVTCRVVDRIEECATPNLCPLAGKCQRSATEGIK